MINIEQIHIEDINVLFREIDNLDNENKWVFRGQKDSKRKLFTSFDLMFEKHQCEPGERRNKEIALIKKFQRNAHLYGIDHVGYTNIPEWLSIMRHYGAPSRLLDWSHSPWVALFFAFDDINLYYDENPTALFVLDWKELAKHQPDFIKNSLKVDHNFMQIDDFNKAMECGPGVMKLNSYKQNERQVIQQGTFLFPLDIEKTFHENLDYLNEEIEIKKFIIPLKYKESIVKKLFRMNITGATLFPDLMGFSRSLKDLYYIEGLLEPEDNIKENGFLGFKTKFDRLRT